MFDATPSAATHSLLQDPNFAAALRLCGQDPVTLPSGLLLLRRRIAGVPILMLPRAVPPRDLARQLRQAKLHRLPLIMSPENGCAMPASVRLSRPRNLLEVDLTAAGPARRGRLHQNWRNQLKKAENSPLRVLHRPFEVGHPLLRLNTIQARERRYQNWPPALTAAFARVAPHQTHLFTARMRGHPVAYMLFFTHGNRATYHIGYNSDDGRAFHAHNLLMWNAMQTLSDLGITRLELGPQTTPQIDRFKLRAGATQHQTGGTWLRWAPFARAA